MGLNLQSPDIFIGASKIHPEPKPVDAPGRTPENVARLYKTAVKNLRSGSDGDLEAAGLMARKALEAAVNLSGGEGRSLKQKITDLVGKGVITSSMAQWADEIRDIGNNAAHEDEPFSQEDAEQTVFFADTLFNYLFTLPGMIAERRRKTSE